MLHRHLSGAFLKNWKRKVYSIKGKIFTINGAANEQAVEWRKE